MRRKHKVSYYVQDWSINSRLWWNRGDWRKTASVHGSDRLHFLVGTEVKPVGVGGATNMKQFLTLKSAMYWARRLKAKGGEPIILRRVIRKGESRCQEWTLR